MRLYVSKTITLKETYIFSELVDESKPESWLGAWFTSQGTYLASVKLLFHSWYHIKLDYYNLSTVQRRQKSNDENKM